MGLKSLVNTVISFLPSAAFVAVLGMAPSAFAALTLSGTITGVSNQDLTDATKPIIYGGFTGGCTTDGANDTGTCDSCKSVTGIATCSLTNAYDNLKVTFVLGTTVTGFVANDFRAESGSYSKTTFASTPTIDGAGVVTVQMTWAEICNVLKAGGVNSCNESMSGELTLRLKNSSNDESIVVSVHTRVVAAGTEFYEDCGGEDPSSTTNWGVCHFSAFKGDGKVYAKDLVYTASYPTSTVSGIPYTGVVFFIEKDDTGTVDDNTLLSRISSKSQTHSISVNTTNSKLADNRVTGLANDVRYCMILGNQDATGIISGFTPLPSSGQTTTEQLCQTPTLVVGLLDDKKCFIATAAFGSSMAPEVESFREFRNNFLLTNPLGKSFVKFYYKHSPYFANIIAQSEVAKAAVRLALWPLLIFARVALVFGVWVTLAFVALGLLGIFEVYRRFFVARRFRGEL